MFHWTLFTTLNILSIICSTIMVLIMLSFWLYKRNLVERISFRLVGLCAICDVLRHTFRIIQIYSSPGNLSQTTDDQTSLFQISSTIAEMALLTFILYTFEIILNLQLVLIHQVRIMINHQIIYFVMPPAFVLVLTVVSEFVGALVLFDMRIYLSTIVVFVLFAFVLSYTLIVCILIVVKLIRTTRVIVQFNPFGIPNPEKNEADPMDGAKKAGSFSATNFLARKAVRQAVIHILMYPIAMLIVGFPNMAVRILYLVGPSLGINVNLDWEEYSNALQGIINFACFLLDPGLYTAFQSVKRDLLSVYTDEKSGCNSSPSTSTRKLAIWCTERFILRVPQISGEEEAHTLILVNSKYKEISTNLIDCEQLTNKIKHL